MTKLSDMQRQILSAAAARPDRNLLPLPESMRGGAAAKVVGALLAKGLAEEIAAGDGQPVWKEAGDGIGMTLVATEGGVAAVAAGDGPVADEVEEKPQKAEDALHEPSAAPAASKTPTVRAGTKQAALIDLLRTERGATIDELATALGWQAHTVRGAMAGALKKKLGLEVTSEKVESRGRVYRLPAA